MDKFIKMLLETETTVILPDFGAIVVENEDTGSLTFNEYIKYNDGKLDEIIVENSNMDLQEAQNYIAKNIREIQQEIDKGNEYSIFELGSFKKDKDGSILFDGNINFKGAKKADKQKDSSDAVQGPSPSPSKKDKEDTKKVEKSENKKEKEAKKTDKTDKKVEDPKKSKAKEASKKETESSNKKEDKKAKATSKKAEKLVKKEKTKKDKPPKKKKKTAVIIILILVLGAFATAGILIATNYDEFKEMMGWDKFEKVKTAEEVLDEDQDEIEELDPEEKNHPDNESDDEELNEEDSEEIDEETEPEIEVEEPEVVEEPKPASVEPTGESGKFYLIAGTFSSKSNAEGLVEELKSKGHNAEIIGFLNNMHYVSVSSFNSRQDAVNKVNSVQNDAPGAWVYKKP